MALLLSASLAMTIPMSSASASSQGGQSASTAQDKQNHSVSQTSKSQQNNPNGGSPNSSAPGRVTGETPSEVQQALDQQLPTGSDVTASVADDGSLKLTGTVKSEADKAKAEQLARSVSGRNINNKLQVKSGQGSLNEGPSPKK
jgi:osmotically-inducible protein OsmY